MAILAHIIAVSSRPQEIEECCVPLDKVATRTATLKKRFETVFVLREFKATRDDLWRTDGTLA